MKFTKKTQLSITGLVLATLGFLPSLASAVAGDASAVSTNIMNSSPLWADSAASYHACNVVNNTTAGVRLKIEVLDSAGAVKATSGAAAITIPPGSVIEVSAAGTGYTGFARCRISGASPENIRANLSVFRWTGTYYETLSTSEVR